MAATCSHGLPASECLICQTLAPAAGPGVSPMPARRDRSEPVAGRERSVPLHLAGIVVGIVAIGAVAWLVAGVVFAILHVLELVVVAGVAGWAGYRLGYHRGGRRPR